MRTLLISLCLLNGISALTLLDSYSPSSLLTNAWVGGIVALRYLTSHSLPPAFRPALRNLHKRITEPAYHQCVLSKTPGNNVLGANGTAPATWGIETQTTTTITRSIPTGAISSTDPTTSTSTSSTFSSSTSTSQASSSAAPTPTTATSDPPPSTTSTTSSTSPSPSSIWNLVESFTGQSFFNGFTFWDETVDGGDPTHGLVDYVGYQTAQDLGLVSINQQQHAVISVSTAAINSTVSRPSIRISTTRTFTGGLIIADIYHMPTGCGTWPSFWTCGPNWPQGGEIDIIEGIHQASINTASIHTNPGCYMPANYGASGSLLTQPPTGLDCSAADTNDAGCGLIASGQNTYGAGFNTAGGGVYAMQWDETGIYSFFFPRGTTPADITSGYPNPSSWGEPVGAWPASTCNPYQFFYNHVAIFDTTLCGDWAGAAWYGTPLGQSQNCAQITGYSDCNSYVTANGSAFAQAYWEIASVALYQKAGQGA